MENVYPRAMASDYTLALASRSMGDDALMRPRLPVLPFFIATSAAFAFTAACGDDTSSSGDGGASTTGSSTAGSSSGSTNSGTTSGATAGGTTSPGTTGATAGSTSAGSVPKTSSGQVCVEGAIAAAATTCSIPGTYQVTESLCSSDDAACQPNTTAPYTWTATVTVTGQEVKLTNGTDRLLRCDLSGPCTCAKGDSLYHFTATGFEALGRSGCVGSGRQVRFDVGVKQ